MNSEVMNSGMATATAAAVDAANNQAPVTNNNSSQNSSASSSSAEYNNPKANLIRAKIKSNKKREKSKCWSSLFCCCCRLFNHQKCFISLWSTLYSVIIVALHVYFIHNAIQKCVNLNKNESIIDFVIKFAVNVTTSYSHYRSSVQLMNYELVIRLANLAVSILTLIVFFVCSLAKVGNYANDAVKFGRDFFAEKNHYKHHGNTLKHIDSNLLCESSSSMSSSDDQITKNKKCSCSCASFVTDLFKLVYRHSLPFSSTFHLISILCLILPDLLFASTRHRANYFDQSSSFNRSMCVNATTPFNPFTCLLRIQENKSSDGEEARFERSMMSQQLGEYRYEVASVILALATLAIKYGNVFWYTNKTLSFLVTLVCSLAGLQQLVQIYSFWYLSSQIVLLDSLRVSFMTNEMSEQRSSGLVSQPFIITGHTRIGHHSSSRTDLSISSLFTFNYLLIDTHAKLLFLYALLAALCYLTTGPVYAFAYARYRERIRCEEALFIKSMQTSPSHQQSKEIDAESSLKSMIKSNKSHVVSGGNGCCYSYCPHLIATVQLILICALKLPFCYDFIIYFNHLKDYGIMVCIIVEIMHTVVLLFIWLLLTLKTEWRMHLRMTYSICHWTYHLKLNDRATSTHRGRINGSTVPAIVTSKRPISTLGEHMTQASDTTVDNLYDNAQVVVNRPHNYKTITPTNSIGRPELPQNGPPPHTDTLNTSEIVYRNEIRKSMRHMVNQKQQQPPGTISGSFSRNSTCVPAATTFYTGNQQQIYRNGRQIISKSNNETLDVSGNISPIYMITGNVRKTSPRLATTGISQYQCNETTSHGGNTLTICSSRPSKFETVPDYQSTQQLQHHQQQQRVGAPVLYLSRSPAQEYESRV